jgi:glycine/serine hydroxymethyltransferase
MGQVAELIGRALRHRDDDAELGAVRDDVRTLCSKFTPYP